MTIEDLPTEILITIIALHLPQNSSLKAYLGLRLLSRQFNEIVLHSLFDLDVCRLHFPAGVPALAKNEAFVLRFWKAFFRLSRDGRIDEASPQTTQEILLDQDRKHITKIRSALQSALQQLPLQSTFVVGNYVNRQSLNSDLELDKDNAIITFCKAAVVLHGPKYAWDLLTTNVEEDYCFSYMKGDSFIPSHYSEVWMLYAAAYLNDIPRVAAILEPLKIVPADKVLWRLRLSADYVYFVQPRLRQRRGRPRERFDDLPTATLEEQRWVKLVGSTFVIAASLGHIDLVSYLIQLEPNLPRNAFRTHLYRSKGNSGMGMVITKNQKDLFRFLIERRYPLVTSTGFARTNYFNALRMALERAHYGIGPGSILRSLLDMTSVWQCDYILNSMLHHAAKINHVELGKLVLDRITSRPSKLFEYGCIKNDTPRWTLGSQPRNFALGTATYFGHVEFVRFLLDSRSITAEASIAARDCALHALICHVPKITDSHFDVLRDLLKHTEDLLLESVIMKAAVKHDEQLLCVLAENINLNQKIFSDLTREDNHHCYGTEKIRHERILNDEDRATLGEVALAAALRSTNLKGAVMLIKDHGTTLSRHSVNVMLPAHELLSPEYVMLDELCLETGMRISVMEIQSGENSDRTCLLFQPRDEDGIKFEAFNSEIPLYCKL